MRKLALNDEILLSIQQPARYIGGEVNMVNKDPKKVDVRFAMCFPDVYEIGMSHLGIQILYDMFNRRDEGEKHSAFRCGKPGSGKGFRFFRHHAPV